MNDRKEYFDFAKGISIILVVIFHSTMALNEYTSVSSVYWAINEFMAPIRMPVFFFISGFLAKNTIKSLNDRKFSSKIFSFVYLFLLWTYIHLIWQAIIPINGIPSFKDWITSTYSPSSVLWFIWALAIYFCIARIGIFINKNIFLLFSIIISFLFSAGIVEFENYVYNNFFIFMPVFLFGAWRSNIFIKSPLLTHPLSLFISLVAFIILFIITYRNIIPAAWSETIFSLKMLLGIIVGLTASEFLCHFSRLKAIPNFIGRNTLSIYVAHSPIALLLAFIFGPMSSNYSIINYVGVPIISMLSICASLAIKIFFEWAGLWWLYKAPNTSKNKIIQK